MPLGVDNMTAGNGTAFVLVGRLTNSYTNDLFWFAILITLMIIAFLLLIAFGIRVAASVSIYSGFMMGLLLRTLEFINQRQMVTLIILAALAFLYLSFTSKTTA